jgi:hypothetical protein
VDPGSARPWVVRPWWRARQPPAAASSLIGTMFTAIEKVHRPRVPQLNGAPGHADRYRRSLETCRRREPAKSPGHTFESCSNEDQQICGPGAYTPPVASDHKRVRSTWPLSLLTCNDSIMTRRFRIPITDKPCRFPPRRRASRSLPPEGSRSSSGSSDLRSGEHSDQGEQWFDRRRC